MLLLAGFLALQALQLGVGISGLLHIGEEAAGLVNEAGRQRYRTLLLGTLARQAMADGAWTAEGHEQFLAVWKEYEFYFAEFQRLPATGRKSLQLQPPPGPARARWAEGIHGPLARGGRQWGEGTPAAVGGVRSGAPGPGACGAAPVRGPGAGAGCAPGAHREPARS